MAIIICKTGAGGRGFLDFIAAILHIITPDFRKKKPDCTLFFRPLSLLILGRGGESVAPMAGHLDP
jgi:hypothetical protein